jgi:hypothetical protein
MPNWCCNALKVTGPKKALDAFKATLNTKDENGNEVPFSYAQVVPPPANMYTGDLGAAEKQMCAEKGIPNWHDWQNENWGVKWDASDPVVFADDKQVFITFQSPWGPPIKWLENASLAHPKLKFVLAYCEGGMGFFGETVAKNGMIDDGTQDFPSNTFDDDGNINEKGKVYKFTEKWGIGTGG